MQGATVQVSRIAAIRKIPVEKINALVEKCIETPLAGLFGTEKVNVLQLNIELDKFK